MSMTEYLSRFREEMPQWLRNYRNGDKVEFTDILDCRTLYYPGSGYDGQPVATFNKAHACHCHIYVDFLYTKLQLSLELRDRYSRFKGYHSLGNYEFREDEIRPKGYVPYIPDGYRLNSEAKPITSGVNPFCLIEILERDEGFGDDHGCERFAVVFLMGDGICSYQALFSKDGWGRKPWALVLQDHGFGGNYDRFGNGGLMEAVARHDGSYPSLALVATNTDPWANMELIPEAGSVEGGMHKHERRLYRVV